MRQAAPKFVRCKYCGAELRRDAVGQFCPTPNCQWRHGLPPDDDTPTANVCAFPECDCGGDTPLCSDHPHHVPESSK